LRFERLVRLRGGSGVRSGEWVAMTLDAEQPQRRRKELRGLRVRSREQSSKSIDSRPSFFGIVKRGSRGARDGVGAGILSGLLDQANFKKRRLFAEKVGGNAGHIQ
jgi:hypothetical protein